MSKPIPILAIVAITILVSSCTSSPKLQDDSKVDAEYISIASKNENAQSLLKAFPQAEASVDASGRLAVDFRVTTAGQRLRLRVFIDAATKQPTESLIECDGALVQGPTDKSLQQYLESGRCP